MSDRIDSGWATDAISAQDTSKEKSSTSPLPVLGSGAVWDLVCGLPSQARAERRMMALQAFFDDSKHGTEIFVLGGYIAPAEAWAAFSDEWAEMLTMRPAWNFFKMSECGDSRDERAWEKIKFLHRIIERHLRLQVTVTIDIQLFKKVAVLSGMERQRKNHHHYAIRLLMHDMVHALLQHNKIHEPIDFIFDTQDDIMNVVNESWAIIQDSFPPKILSFINNPPIFRDEKKFLPLQAADFISWWARHQYSQEQQTTKIDFTSPCKQFSWKEKSRKMTRVVIEPDEEYLRIDFENMKKAYKNNKSRFLSLIPKKAADKFLENEILAFEDQLLTRALRFRVSGTFGGKAF